jgi:hypothetical protein
MELGRVRILQATYILGTDFAESHFEKDGLGVSRQKEEDLKEVCTEQARWTFIRLRVDCKALVGWKMRNFEAVARTSHIT